MKCALRRRRLRQLARSAQTGVLQALQQGGPDAATRWQAEEQQVDLRVQQVLEDLRTQGRLIGVPEDTPPGG
jgi:hypothetical protein